MPAASRFGANKLTDGTSVIITEIPGNTWYTFTVAKVTDEVTARVSGNKYQSVWDFSSGRNLGKGVQLEFTSPVVLKAAKFYGQHSNNYRRGVQYWDGSAWVQLTSASTNTADEDSEYGDNGIVVSFNASGAISSTLWRWVVVNYGNFGASEMEFEVYTQTQPVFNTTDTASVTDSIQASVTRGLSVVDVITASDTTDRDDYFGTYLLTAVSQQDTFEELTLTAASQQDTFEELGLVFTSQQDTFEALGLTAPVQQATSVTTLTVSSYIDLITYERFSLSSVIAQTTTELTLSLSTSFELNTHEVFSIGKGVSQTTFDASLGVSVNASGTTIPAGFTNPPPSADGSGQSVWSAKVYLKGVEVSSRLTGSISVDLEEDAAAIATFSLKPLTGLIVLTDWVRASVEIQYVKTDNANTPSEVSTSHTLFKGVVDVPSYDTTTKLTQFTCTDELQKVFEDMTTAQIDSVVGGFWSDQVFSGDTDKWSYALDRLSTQPYSLDMDVNNVLVKTAWAAKAVPDLTYNAAAIVDQSLSVDLAKSRQITNDVTIELEYAYDLFKERKVKYGWAVSPSIFSCIDGVYYAHVYPSNSDIISAATQGGWVLASAPAFTPLPTSGFKTICGGQPLIFSNDHPEGVLSTSFTVVQRYNQFAKEKYTMRLSSPKSIDNLGSLKLTEAYSVSAEASEEFSKAFNEVITDTLSYTVYGTTSGNSTKVSVDYPTYLPLGNLQVFPGTQDIIYDVEGQLTAGSRADFEEVVSVVQNLHKTTILNSHRSNSVTFSGVLEPSLNRALTLKVDTSNVQAQGKVTQVLHEVNIEEGSAISTVTINVSKASGVGIPDVETPLDKTTEVIEPDVDPPATGYSVSLGTYVDFIPGSIEPDAGWFVTGTSGEFTVDLPDISGGNIDELVSEVASSFVVEVPEELLILNA